MPRDARRLTRVFDALGTPDGYSAEHPNISRRSAHLTR